VSTRRLCTLGGVTVARRCPTARDETPEPYYRKIRSAVCSSSVGSTRRP